MATRVEFTAQAARWFRSLGDEQAAAVAAAFDQLARDGPGLGRPFVKAIRSSRHRGMSELRPPGSLRALFAFDPRGRAVVLLGGDKSDDWRGWYERNVPVADRLYDQHLRRIGGEDRWQSRRTGERYAASGR